MTNDLENWRGFRELYLNGIRNTPDFRVHGSNLTSNDKSVHQFQAIELPYGKVLVAVGQNASSRRMVIFDPNWLEETSRDESFDMGLSNVSTHLYVNSWSGCGYGHGQVGHCAWNRTNGALLVPDPDCDYNEVLQLCRIHDPRLFSEKQGLTWNFPQSSAGEVRLILRREGSGIRIALCDRWFNPCDDTTGELSPFSFTLTERVLRTGHWYDVVIRFNTDERNAVVLLNDRFLCNIPMKYAPAHGISYLHLQTAAEQEDFQGVLIRKLSYNGA